MTFFRVFAYFDLKYCIHDSIQILHDCNFGSYTVRKKNMDDRDLFLRSQGSNFDLVLRNLAILTLNIADSKLVTIEHV